MFVRINLVNMITFFIIIINLTKLKHTITLMKQPNCFVATKLRNCGL